MPEGNDPPFRALVVDDEADARSNIVHILAKAGIESTTAASGEEALGILSSQQETYSVVLLDVVMPGLDGFEVLTRIRQMRPTIAVVIVTGSANVRQAVMAMKDGAYDYIIKPFDNNEVARVTFSAMTASRSHAASVRRNASSEFESLFETMGTSAAVARITADINRVAPSDYSVLITGETGAGKDLLSTAIHKCSPRGSKPFVTVDCGSIPETLMESELFGHEKGSFTSADRQRIGKFEAACGGTLFLDEIANLPFTSQAKLLRAIQSRSVYRIGGTKPIPVDFRLVSATNRDLREMVAAGEFREDLYYRICDFSITIPSLRERKEDIIYLAKRFLQMSEKDLDKRTMGLTEASVKLLISYHWPGNARELKSVIRRATLLASGAITEADLGIELSTPDHPVMQGLETTVAWGHASLKDIIQQNVDDMERRILTGVLTYTGGNKARAARLLQIDYKTLYSKLKKLGIEPEGVSDEHR